jgi:hypothetical protein
MFSDDTHPFDHGIAYLDHDFLPERGSSRAEPETSASTYVAPSLHRPYTSFIAAVQSPHLLMETSSLVNDDASATTEATYLESWPSTIDPTFDPIFDLSGNPMDTEHCAMSSFMQPTAIGTSEYMDCTMDVSCLQGLVGVESYATPCPEDSHERFDLHALPFAPGHGHTNSCVTQHGNTSRASDTPYGDRRMESIAETLCQDPLVASDKTGLELGSQAHLSYIPRHIGYRRRDSVLGTFETSQASSSLQRGSKLYFCKEPNCKSAGFVYHFDLQRHKRTVHRGQGTGYRCALPDCPKADKLWIRHDSYKKHVKNHHSGVRYSGMEGFKTTQPNDESRFPFSITTQQMMMRKTRDAEHTE